MQGCSALPPNLENEMGEAKRRGTFEERRAQAIEKEKRRPKAAPISPYEIRPRGKSRAGLMLASALLMAATSQPYRK